MISPKVSVIIPTYNRSELLLETLESVRNQSFQDWECIIVDDGSIDNTKEIVSNIIVKDSRFQFYSKPENYSKGASISRNYGFELSRGKYIQWLDDDDLISENKLELQVLKLESLNDSRIITCCEWAFLNKKRDLQKRNIFNEKQKLNCENYFNQLRIQLTFCPIHVFLMPRTIIIKSGTWNTDLFLNQDAEFMSRIMLESDCLVNTEECFVLYREHYGERISSSNDVKAIESLLLSLQLMSTNLQLKNITCVPFFKWKLFIVFFKYWNAQPEILKKYYWFFKQNGIDLNYAFFYKLKHSLYKQVYPWYKSKFKRLYKK